MDENPYEAPQELRASTRKRNSWIPAAAVLATIGTLPGAFLLFLAWAHAGMLDPKIVGFERTIKILERMFFDLGYGTWVALTLMAVPWIVFTYLFKTRPTHS